MLSFVSVEEIMNLTEKKILEKEEIKKEKNAIYEEVFEEWINYIDTKPFDLNKTKTDIFYDFYNVILEKKSYSKLIEKIFKTYYLKDKKAMEGCYDAADMLIPATSYNNIFKKYLDENIQTAQEHNCVENDDVIAAVADAVVTNMVDIFGDIFMFKMPMMFVSQYPDVSKDVKTTLENRGFSNFDSAWTLIARPDSKKEVVVKEEHQKYLLDGYEKMSKMFCLNTFVNYANKFGEQKFIQLYGIVEKFLQNVEARLTEESKQNPEFLKLKAQNAKFFETKLIPYIKDLSIESKSDDFYERVSKAVEMYTKKTASSADERVLRRFYNRLNVLEKALSIPDENGEAYGPNYFIVMPIDPILLYGLLPRFEKCGFLNKEEVNGLLELRKSMNGLFSRVTHRDVYVTNLEKFLEGYKGTFIKNGKTVTVDDNNFPQFMQKVRGVIDEYNLPMTRPCINSIAYRVSRGCEKVVDIGDLDIKKLEGERTI